MWRKICSLAVSKEKGSAVELERKSSVEVFLRGFFFFE
jgi:hypothetical protein